MEPGTVVMATLGQTEEGKDRIHFGALRASEFYRVSGTVRGNQGEVTKVKLAGVSEYWPADLFTPVPQEILDQLAAKVKELDALGEGKVVAKSVRVAMEGLV
jgi:hypothetical protein